MSFLQTLRNIQHKTELSWWQFWLLCLFFMTFSFGQVGRVDLGSSSFYLHDIVLVTWLLCNVKIVKNVLIDLKIAVQSRYWWPAVAFLIWVLLGMSIALVLLNDPTPWLYITRVLAYILFLFCLYRQMKTSPMVLRILLVSSGLYMVAFGLLQYFFIPDTRYLETFGWDEHYYRLIGPLLDPNLSGILYIIIAWVIFSLRRVLPRPILLASVIATVTAIVLTYSRATYLAAALSVLFFFVISFKRSVSLKKFAVALILLVVGSVFIYQLAPKPGGDGVNLLRTTSIFARIENTQLYISSLKPYQWLTGNGFYTILPGASADTHARVPDNFIVLLLVNTGIIGLLLFFTFFTRLLPYMLRCERETLAAFVALIIHSQLNNSLLEPFIFLAMGITLISQLKPRK